MRIAREHIEGWSLRYHLLKFYVDRCFRVYFKTTVSGIEKVPFGETLIFAPNHQNTLIDALAVLQVRTWQPVFLARADIFKKPLVIKVLTLLKIMPVYRIRDGYQNLTLNDEIFQKTLDVLKNKNGLVILPEGNHLGQRRLRPLKKGIARIAFQAEDASNGGLNIKIIPIGIDYSHYVRFGSQLLISFGEPIEVKKHLDLYRTNQALGYNALIEDISEGMKTQMVHIEDEANYEAYEEIVRIYAHHHKQENRAYRKAANQLKLQQAIVAAIDKLKIDKPNEFAELIDCANNLKKITSKHALVPTAPFVGKRELLGALLSIPLLLITFPIFLYGAVNNAVPIWIPYWVSLKFQDAQFHSSLRLVLGLILFPLWYIILALLFWLIIGNGLLALGYVASLPLSATALYYWRKQAQSAYSHLKTARALSENVELKKQLPLHASRIISILKSEMNFQFEV